MKYFRMTAFTDRDGEGNDGQEKDSKEQYSDQYGSTNLRFVVLREHA
jgi:hypothetical protein